MGNEITMEQYIETLGEYCQDLSNMFEEIGNLMVNIDDCIGTYIHISK